MIYFLLDHFANEPLSQQYPHQGINDVQDKLIALKEALGQNVLNNMHGVLDSQRDNAGKESDKDCQEISKLSFTEAVLSPLVEKED